MSANGGCAGHTQAADGNGYARKANGIESSGKSCAVINDASTAGPDGKLSWVIAITCFVVNLIGSCFFRCTGMFFSYVMDTFNAARGEASVPLSLYGGFYNMAGIVAGALMESFGVRCTFILGGLMMTVGFSVSLFATSALFLVFTVGVLAGVGHGMVTSCCIVAVTRYFDKRRGIALGLNLAGPPMASLLVSKLLEWLLSEFGLRGTFLVLGGCMANIPVLGILLRNPPWEKSVGEGVNDTVEDSCCEAVKSGALPFNRSNVHLCDRISLKGSPMEGGCGRRSTKTSVPNFSVRFSDRKTIPTIIPTGTASKETGSSVNVEHRLFSRVRPLVSEQRFSIASRRSTLTGSVGPSSRQHSLIAATVSPKSEAMERRGTMMSVAASLLASRRASQIERDGQSRRATLISSIGYSIFDNVEHTNFEPTTMPAEAPSSALSSLKEVLCAPRMYLHTFSFFTCAFFMDSYLTVMFDLGEDVGVAVSECVLALSLSSAMDVVGRLFVPFLTDYGLTSSASLLTMSYAALAVISAFMPCVSGRLVYLAVSALLGLPSGYILVGTSETLSKELGTKNLPMAYGVLAFIAALGGFARPPVLGLFRDGFGSYDGLFLLMAGMLLASGLFNVGLWITACSFNKKDRTKEAAQNGSPVTTSEPRPGVICEDQCTSL